METLKNIPVNIREIRPVFLLSVPALAKTSEKTSKKELLKKESWRKPSSVLL
jgi:long-chain acyl-CoA synthetase